MPPLQLPEMVTEKQHGGGNMSCGLYISNYVIQGVITDLMTSLDMNITGLSVKEQVERD